LAAAFTLSSEHERLGADPIAAAGQDAVAARWLPAGAAGDAVAAFARSEPQAGSDAAGIELAAEPDGDGWRLVGEKAWISNAPDADVYIYEGTSEIQRTIIARELFRNKEAQP
jgi:alkylation response protein AidB-like acyl-CoA dehydrogenase